MDELGRLGRGRETVDAGREALRLARQALGADHLEVGRIAAKLAVAYVNVMEYKAAFDCGESAVRIVRAAQNRKPADLAFALYALGTAETRLGRLQSAEQHLKEACEMCRTSSGAYDEQSGPFWLSLGDVYVKLGRYSEAERYLLVGLGVADRNPKTPPVQHAQALEAVGVFYVNMGDAARAEPYLARSLTTFQKELPPDDPRLADSMDAVGRMNRLLGEHVLARRCLEESLAIRKKRADTSPFELSQTLQLLANVELDIGNLQGAYTRQAEGLRLIQDVPGIPPRTVATAMNNLGWFAMGLSRLDEAESLLRRSLALAERTSGGESEDAANTRASLALVGCLRKDIPGALENARTSHRIYQGRLAEVMKMGTEDQKQSFVRKIEGKTHFAVELHLAHSPDNAETARYAFETILQSKGLVAEAVSIRMAEVRRNADAKTGEDLRALSRRRSELSHMALTADKRFDYEESRRLWVLQRDIDQGVRDLQWRSARAPGAAEPPVTIDRVRQALPPGSALLEYVTYRRANPALTSQQRKKLPAECGAYVLFPDGQFLGVSLGSMGVIGPKVNALRRDIVNPGAPGAAENARALAAAILDPVLARLSNVKTLFIAPDDVLHLVPFGILPDSKGQILLDRVDVVYLNAGRDLLLRQPDPVLSLAPPVIIAAADFDAATPREAAGNTSGAPSSRSGMLFGPLPGTAREAEAIARIMPGARTSIGGQASEDLLKSIRSPAVLHIATHGFFLDDRGSPEGDVRGLKKFAPAQPVARKQAVTPDFDIYKHPYLRSGLALAGANRFPAGGEDGIVTAMEVADLDLRGTPLVVLSACETGVGDAVSGAGVFGLRRAFMEAGAATQVLSLWKVHDEATAEVMRLFYEELRQGAGRAAALRNAQLSLRKEREEWQHPFYWGAFIVSGDWRPCLEPWKGTGAK